MTMKNAWHAAFKSAQDASKLHKQLQENLVHKISAAMEGFKSTCLQKRTFGGLQNSYKFVKKFDEAQKEWAKKKKEVVKYQNQVQDLSAKKIQLKDEISALEGGDPLRVKKTKDSEKTEKDLERSRMKLSTAVSTIREYTEKYYREKMENVYQEFENYERRRMEDFIDCLRTFRTCVSEDMTHGYKNIADEFEKNIRTADVSKDLVQIRATKGPGMPLVLPDEQGFPMQLKRKVSKKLPMNAYAEAMRSGGHANPNYNYSTGEQSAKPPSGENSNFGPVYETVPTNRVQETVYSPSSMPQAPPVPGGSRPANSNAGRAPGSKVKALYDYEAQNADEIKLEYGNILSLVTQSAEVEEGWLKGRAMDGKIGIFPASYVENYDSGSDEWSDSES